jgi:serine phosphatase RsbU (regulator of sigma subunit)
MAYTLTLADISGETWSELIEARAKVLGRAHDADILLDHASVSRQHCRFWVEDGHSYVQDCGSTNGTFLNGVKITGRERIKPGDTIGVGKFELVVEDQRQVQETAEIPIEVPSQVVLLDQRSEERQLARVVHQRLNPTRHLELPGLTVEVLYKPSGALGGDSFETVELPNRWILAMFDPMTHGVKAAINSMLLRSELTRWVSLASEPGRCLQWVNTELVLLGSFELFVSAVVATWFPRTQTLVYASAGQHPPLLLHKGKIQNANEVAGGLPLGIETGEHFTECLRQLKAHDRVIFLTDGVCEALRAGGETTHPLGSAVPLLESTAGLAQTDQLKAMLRALPEEPSDDLLIVSCEVLDD